MYTPLIRLILILLATIPLVLGIVYSDRMNIGMGLVAILALIWGYFKSGTVYLSFKYLSNGDYGKAEDRLKQTKNPEWLSKTQKSYYHFCWGFILANKQELSKSVEQFLLALQLGLRTENDKTIVLHQLAEIEFAQKNYSRSQDYLNQAKQLEYKPLVKSEIDKLQKQLDTLNN